MCAELFMNACHVRSATDVSSGHGPHTGVLRAVGRWVYVCRRRFGLYQ